MNSTRERWTQASRAFDNVEMKPDQTAHICINQHGMLGDKENIKSLVTMGFQLCDVRRDIRAI